MQREILVSTLSLCYFVALQLFILHAIVLLMLPKLKSLFFQPANQVLFIIVCFISYVVSLYSITYIDRTTTFFSHAQTLPQVTVRAQSVDKQNLAQIPVTATPTLSPTPTLIPTATVSPTPQQTWEIQSVSSMKETKDKICNQDSPTFINHWVDKAKDLGANYVAIATPYDNPSCGNSEAYTKEWIAAIRAHGLHVWHRHMPVAFEGIYNAHKTVVDFLPMITQYIKQNPTDFQPGDIFTPIPEPQNGGIQGVNTCIDNICQFANKEAFNQWLRDAMTQTTAAFASIGLANQIKVGYFGFDGYITWGDHNPDWHGILEPATVKQMGEITIDHYPETVGETMAFGLDQLQAKYPHVPIIIGEWGTITGGDVVSQVYSSMGAAKRPGVIGFNYWHLGMGGNEALINDDFSNKPQFAAVQSFYRPKK